MFATLKAVGGERLAQLQELVAPPAGEGGEAGGGPAAPEDPARAALRALAQPPARHKDGSPEMRLLVLLQPPEALPEAPAAAGLYAPAVLAAAGGLLHVSGQGPRTQDGTYLTGKVADAAEGRKAARACALTVLAQLRAQLTTLNAVKRVVKATVFVNSAPGFAEQPAVADGFSEVMVEVFGEAGRAARSAVGVAELPFGWSVEAELVVEAQAP